MAMRRGMGKSALGFLAVALAAFTLCSGLFSAAGDFDNLRSEIAVANSSGSRTITLGGDIVLTAALPPITGRVTIDGGGHSISGNDAYQHIRCEWRRAHAQERDPDRRESRRGRRRRDTNAEWRRGQD